MRADLRSVPTSDCVRYNPYDRSGRFFRAMPHHSDKQVIRSRALIS